MLIGGERWSISQASRAGNVSVKNAARRVKT
jgi:hypothetical protein